MDKDTILDYVTETPGNTNRAVLSGMLDSIEGGGSGSNVVVVTFNATGSNDDYTITSASHSVDEVKTLVSTNANIYAKLSIYDTNQQMTDVRISSNIQCFMYDGMVVELNFYFTGYVEYKVKSKVDETGWDLLTLV